MLQGLQQLETAEKDHIKKLSSTNLIAGQDVEELRKLDQEAEQLKNRVSTNIDKLSSEPAPVPSPQKIEVDVIQGTSGQQDPTPESKPEPEDEGWPN